VETMYLDNMVRGWFVGSFEPSALNTRDVEVGVKSYKAGDTELKHYHKIATEITVVLSGKVKINNREFTKGDMIILKPGEASEFTALTDAINVVVKHPGARDDKYLCQGEDHA